MSIDKALPHDKSFPAIEAHMRMALERYVNNGITPGNFLTSVLENDLAWAVTLADKHNKANLAQIVGYIMTHLPVPAWGNKARVSAWIERVQEATNLTKSLQQAG